MSGITASNESRESSLAVRRIARLLAPGPAFGLHMHDSQERAGVQQYIADQFQARHGARLHDFMPFLLTMKCQGRYTAAAGIRPALGQPLFLEQYMPGSVEQAVSQVNGAPVARSEIVEIGNLVATLGGSSQLLFLMITAMLHQAGSGWVVFTATPVVQKALEQLGIELHILCAADPDMLDSAERANWGSYYESRPQVVAGNVSRGMAQLSGRKLYSGVLSLYQNRIDGLAAIIRNSGFSYGTRSFAA